MILKRLKKGIVFALTIIFLGGTFYTEGVALEPSDPIQETTESSIQSNLTIGEIGQIFQ